MKKLYLLISFCLIIDLSCYLSSGISLAGKWSDWLLFWSWIIATPALILQNWKQLWAKSYASALGVLILLSFIPLGVPFLTTVAYAIEGFNQKYDQVVREYRVEMAAQSVIALPYIEVTRMGFMIEKRVGKLPMDLEIGETYFRFSDIQSIRIEEEIDSLQLKFCFEQDTIVKKIRK